MTKEELQMLIGNNIRSQRLARDLSIVELAKLIGKTSGFLGLIERGQRGTTPHMLFSLARVLDISIDTLFCSSKNSASESIEFSYGYAERQKIYSLISDFEVKDLMFLIGTIQSYQIASHSEEKNGGSEQNTIQAKPPSYP